MLRWIVTFVLVLGLAGTGGWWFWARGGEPMVDLRTATVDRGSVRALVSTAGSVSPLVTVEVGSELSGLVSEVLADFNDPVTRGQLIARIDPRTFATRVAEAEAAVAVAEANLRLQQARRDRARALFTQASRDLDRTRALRDRGTVSDQALDAALAGFETTQADIAVAEAQIADAQAQRARARASLRSAEIDLDRTEIRSPIDGVVIDRQVDPGQTVAASFAAPTLFTIAQDLSLIEIDAQVDEADIGQVRAGAPVEFTVDAYPDRRFDGVVEQVRLGADTEQTVVTYSVIIAAENPETLLLPGMTATVEILTGERDDVLTVPVEALRFRPRGAAAEALIAAADAAGTDSGTDTGGDRAERRSREPRAQLWVARADGSIEARSVAIGLIDDRVAEVTGGRLAVGDEVVLRVVEAAS